MKRINRNLLKKINGGGRVPYSLCSAESQCPQVRTTDDEGYCDNGICYRDI